MGISYKETIGGVEYLIGEINARKCKNINLLCKELESSFQWSNIDHINCVDAMYDLSWHSERNYKIIVNKFQSIDNEKMKDLILNELSSYVEYWKEKKSREQKENKNNFIVEYK